MHVFQETTGQHLMVFYAKDNGHELVMLCYRSAAATQVGELYDTGPVLMGLQTQYACV